MEEVGWWEDPREGFILTKPYMARRHVRQTKLPGVREQIFSIFREAISFSPGTLGVAITLSEQEACTRSYMIRLKTWLVEARCCATGLGLHWLSQGLKVCGWSDQP